MSHNVTIFKPYLFQAGQKIRIDGGHRKVDWEVLGMTDKKVTLRCPVSDVEVEWAIFCYFSEERENEQWPLDD